MLRFIGFAAVLALVVLGLPAASTAANHQTFTDAVGDDSQGLAPDITSVDVTSTDNGDMTFRISINEQGGTFFVGDTLAVAIDSDSNGSTGNHGADTILWLFTDTGNLDFELCNYNTDGTRDCHSYPAGGATDVRTGSDSHIVTFLLTTQNWFAVNFYVWANYADPKNPTAGPYDDFAPDNGQYRYDLNDDLDQDGVAGSADKCPSYKGGPLDKNGDGCPPVLPTPGWRWTGGRASGSYASFSQIIVTRAASGVTVTARFQGYTTHRRGTGPLPGISGRRFRVNSHVTIILTNRNYFGTYRMLRVTPGGGLATFATGCTPPGRTTFIPCPKLG